MKRKTQALKDKMRRSTEARSASEGQTAAASTSLSERRTEAIRSNPTSAVPNPNAVSDFPQRVLRWYRRHRRNLPWRQDRDPYRIWISEIMLQQTQVKTVVPHYERFLARFPDVASLARAREDDVVACWSGLGYYSRARNLHRAARLIAECPGRKFPCRFDEILALPGVGRYTAGAIASIAFGRRHPVVDGNVRRLFSRYFGAVWSERHCWDVAHALLPQREVGDYNQALMEIGATVCVPDTPRCDVCPLCPGCQTRGDLPGLRKAENLLPQTMALLALQRGSRFWLGPRSSTEKLLKSLWCFPMEYGTAAPELLQRRLLHRFGLGRGEAAGSFQHSIMKYRFSVRLVRAFCAQSVPAGGAWVKREDLVRYPHSSR